MEVIVLEIILLVLCAFGIGAVFVFFKRKNRPDNSFELMIQNLNQQKEVDLQILDRGNKEINKIEQEILECKKKLKMKLFDK